jgi:hypothetical protein
MIYVSIDVGILNLALIKADVEEFKIKNIIESHVVNLNELTHKHVSREKCTLYHSNDVYDKIEHMLQEYASVFEGATHVLIERQPISGLVHVEQLLFGKFRSMARLVSPNAMHHWMGINHLTYEQRKIETTRVAKPYLDIFPVWVNATRVHDMADSLCILLYTLHVEKIKAQKEQLENERLERQSTFVMVRDRNQDQTMSVDAFLNQFRYIPPISSEEWIKQTGIIE